MINTQELEDIYNEYFKKIYNYVYYRTLNKSAAEDIVSETFLRVVSKLHLYDKEKGNLSAWIYAVCKNCIADYYRKNLYLVNIDDCVNLAAQNNEIAQIENETEKTLYQALALLSEKERIVFYYKYYMGYSNRVIAQVLSFSESTVGNIVFRAHKKIRNSINYEFD